jgi:glyoxylase-like metal-dependent hydrolase (beta-lactamase superfamily II)
MKVQTRHSGIWQLSSTILAVEDGCIVVDPGYFPRELDELARLAAAHGGARAVVFTHGHWDHVIGWSAFPEAEVWVSPALAEAMTSRSARACKDLDAARDFDGRWYVERPAELDWPPPARVRALHEGHPQRLGAAALQPLLLPGHSPDGLALLVPEAQLLLVGDYLSPCEIPFVDDAAAYCATLARLLAILGDGNSDGDLALGTVRQVIPGHGPLLSAAAARQIAAADLRYLRALLACAQAGDTAGALALPLPRAATVPGMADHHRENCQAVGLSL